MRHAVDRLSELAGSFGVYALAEGNGILWNHKAINEKNWKC
jgi:hypothetical protein